MEELLIVLIPSILSIVGGLFIVLSYGLFPCIRSSSQLLAVFLAISGIGYGILTFFHGVIDDNKVLCSATAMLATYFNNTALFTTVVVANYMHRIFFNSPGTQSLQITKRHFFFIWIIPAILACLPFTTGHYGHSENDVFCWIADKDADNESTEDAISMMWQTIVVGIPALSGVLYNFYVYFRIFRKIRALSQSENSTEHDKIAVMSVINRIRWYPIILVLVYILPIVHRIYQTISGENTTLMSALGAGSLKMQGFLDSIVYGLTPSVIIQWKKFFGRCIVCGSTEPREGRSNSSDNKPIIHFSSRFESSFRSETSVSEYDDGGNL